jgi:hypothetical protein
MSFSIGERLSTMHMVKPSAAMQVLSSTKAGSASISFRVGVSAFGHRSVSLDLRSL